MGGSEPQLIAAVAGVSAEEAFVFKTKPFEHQLREWLRSKDTPNWGLFFEQGTGKSKVVIDTAAWLYERGEIDTLLVVAPSPVHANWIANEIPAHLPDRLSSSVRTHVWKTVQPTKNKLGKKVLPAAVATDREGVVAHKGLVIVAVTYDCIMTELGERFVKELLDRKCLLVADESSRIKTAGAKRTMRLTALGRKARYRRILTGTPVANNPFDLYAQIRFLDEDFWKRNRLHPKSAFECHFGRFRNEVFGGRRVPVLVGFHNLDQLQRHLREIGSRVTKDEVLDLPPKIYSRVCFDLDPAARAAYDELRKTFVTEIAEGVELSAPLAMVRLLRLQQIACGYAPTIGDDGKTAPVIPIGSTNPRMSALLEIIEDTPKAIIWARFRADIDAIMGELGEAAVRLDGAVEQAARTEAVRRFQEDPAVRFFVANPAVAGEGLTLTAARVVVYYSNSFNLVHRLQSEDRAHRIGQTGTVNYYDLIANGTVDLKIVDALTDKRNIAALVTGDNLGEWI